jgi:hypothetical protein
MLKEYRLQSILGIWGGFFFLFLGFFLASLPRAVYMHFGYVIMAGGACLFICGCFMYAKGKGRSFAWGFLGLLGLPGLVILYVLKDRSKIILKRRQKELG